MSTTRRLVLALTATATAGAFVLSAHPAGAAVLPPEWPAAGRVPLGCEGMLPENDPASGYIVTYTDTSQPVVTDVSLGGATSLAIPPGGRAIPVHVRATELCSGASGGQAYFSRYGSGKVTVISLAPQTDDVFHATLGGVTPVLPPSAVGVYNVPVTQLGRRYDSFVLNPDFRLRAEPAPVVGTASQYVTGAWSMKRLYLLAQTTVVISSSVSKVRKGRKASVFGVLRYATGAGYVGDNGEKVYVQTKVGTGKWTTRAVLACGRTGGVTYTFAPLKTTQVRLVHPAVHSGRFTAAVTSAVKTITVS